MLHVREMRNRIKDLRKARGWSMRELAARTNSSPSAINQLEKGRSQLTATWLRVLTKVFEVPASEIADLEGERDLGFAEDTAPYEQEPSGPRMPLNDTQFLYEVRNSVLDQLGINPKDILIVDGSKSELDHISSGDIVIAQIDDGTKAVTVLRQFIAPSLLITNSSRHNARIINTRTENAVIKGVVVSTYVNLRRGKALSSTT